LRKNFAEIGAFLPIFGAKAVSIDMGPQFDHRNAGKSGIREVQYENEKG
jgi:hypothetical protein